MCQDEQTDRFGREDEMKYGESSFDILYLLFAIISGCVILGALICMLFYKTQACRKDAV